MSGRTGRYVASVILALAPVAGGTGMKPSLKLIERAPDPHGSPRPARDARDVPLRTSLYFELAVPPPVRAVEADARIVSVSLQADADDAVELLAPGRVFPAGGWGWVRLQGDKSLAVYIEPAAALKPRTHYTVHVEAAPARADGQAVNIGAWSFTTEAAPSVHALEFGLDLKAQPIRWHGRFFSGICNVIFCTQAANYAPTFELMAAARKQHPRAWDLQRDFWLTGDEHRPPSGFFASNEPNIVRERETRRIAAMEPVAGGVMLRVEDFFGHQQYGIPAGRPVGEDYHAGDEVLVADGIHDARAKVVSADSKAGTVTLGPIAAPPGGWKIAYDGPLPARQDPDAPGLFPPGGCYLRKYSSCGTLCYYWGRLDKEWDLAVRRYGRRVLPNFADAPGDLSRDGREWTTVKDYAQWHEAARAIAGHIIDRYGQNALGFTWSIFNEPDLGGLFWRASWDELQTYYDYTTDAILRAFEDRGYDSSKVFIGGLELGAIFGTQYLRLNEYLAHCSPRAQAKGALPLNAAFADRRLDGKRSRRVEALCRAHGGKGSPCDFISIHSYNRSETMAAKLIRAKEIALQIDPDYYKSLWVDSHESCPDWMPPPDEAAHDSYLGDGYFPTWCLDVVHRQLARAASDPRYAYGETIVTVWPPPDNLAGLNAVTRRIHYRENDGRTGAITVPMPIFHVLGLLSDMADEYWLLPDRTVGGHTISGFASRDASGAVRVLLYAHDPQDTQSRSDAAFDVTLDIDGIPWSGNARVGEYRFDRDHNSPFGLIKSMEKSTPSAQPALAPADYPKAIVDQLREACECRPTRDPPHPRVADGRLRLTGRITGNGCFFWVIERPARDGH